MLKILERAVFLLSHYTTRYKLGRGGRRPDDLDPELDCSGFVCKAIGIDRLTEAFPYYGGWIATDSIVAAVNGKKGWFVKLAAPVPGCIVVYPDKFRNGKKVYEGHCAVVMSVPKNWNGSEEHYRAMRVIDCRSRRSPAIDVSTGMAWFNKDAVFAAYVGPLS